MANLAFDYINKSLVRIRSRKPALDIHYGGSLEAITEDWLAEYTNFDSLEAYFDSYCDYGTLTINGPLTIGVLEPCDLDASEDDFLHLSPDEMLNGYIKLGAGDRLVINRYMEDISDNDPVGRKLVNDSAIFGYVQSGNTREYICIQNEPYSLSDNDFADNEDLLEDLKQLVKAQDGPYVFIMHA